MSGRPAYLGNGGTAPEDYAKDRAKPYLQFSSQKKVRELEISTSSRGADTQLLFFTPSIEKQLIRNRQYGTQSTDEETGYP